MLLGQGVGQVGEVVVGIVFTDELEDFLAQVGIGSVDGCSAVVAMKDAVGALFLDTSSDPLDLPDRPSQGSGGLGVGESRLAEEVGGRKAG